MRQGPHRDKIQGPDCSETLQTKILVHYVSALNAIVSKNPDEGEGSKELQIYLLVLLTRLVKDFTSGSYLSNKMRACLPPAINTHGPSPVLCVLRAYRRRSVRTGSLEKVALCSEETKHVQYAAAVSAYVARAAATCMQSPDAR
ncbi:hypothetical protein HPB48_015671 [Haemaphysalis longicornis]|uniref:Uncharacterized protein n=1 Tax=Haemaphysalis longicornis TaxID=44386 RepID=A0A9J6G6N4_HAELO|nr:hypothetical protein HPB48_015671 [Haemaphysalis longicornis]